MIRTLLAASVAVLGVAAPAVAQDSLPAEFPPESYAANQYVDSEGCAFIRAGIGGATNWIPRMSRDRTPLCGFQPTAGVATPTRAAEAEAAPAPERRAEAAPAARPASTPTRTAAAPARRAAPSSPRVVTPQPAAAPAEPPVLTRAAFCAGRSGPQPGYVSSRTGETIICGETRPARAGRAGPPLRGAVTLAAVCADIAATGRRYVLRDTGEPVRCGPQSATAPAPGSRLAATRLPAAPETPPSPVVAGNAPASHAASCNPGAGSGFAMVVPGTLPRRCGPQAQSPSGLASAARVAPPGAVTAMRLLDPQARLRRAAAAMPLPDPASPPPGFRSAWEDGRLNPQRGVRILERSGAGQVPAPVAAAPVAVPTAQAERISTRTAPAAPAAAARGRFVQIGTYAESDNAERAAARLRALGLPVAQGRITKGGTEMRVIATGPFTDAGTMGQVLGKVRAAGYSDAFARR